VPPLLPRCTIATSSVTLDDPDDPEADCCTATCVPVHFSAGFALAFGGGQAVSWYEPRPDFPYVRGIVPIVVSWFLSPLLAALITLVFFLIIRTFVLRRQNSTKIAFWVLPFLIFFTIFVSLLFVLVSHASEQHGCRSYHTQQPYTTIARSNTAY
jgi:phosphate/sulfate permease